jgi:predicted lysophospholipase L1 biosynthesis ABC-type transport system permease subunit
MTVEYGILAFFMGMVAILIGAIIIWLVINYNEKKNK